MIIEVMGIGIPNKGAELMLTSIKNEVMRKYPDMKFVVDPYTDFIGRSQYGVYQKCWLTIAGIQLGYWGKFIPRAIRKRYGLIIDSEVDIVLDASGFAYGDKWGALKAHYRLGKYIKKWRKKNKTIILMPQAFGPFDNNKLAEEMRIIVGNSNLVFARDADSFKYIESIAENDFNLFQAPDLTTLCSGVVPNEIVGKDLGICFIPNSKMIEMTSGKVAENYVESLSYLIRMCQEKRRKPYILIHEGKRDYAIAEQVNERLDLPVEILKFNYPMEIKGVIGCSNMVVSSRFHGLVSSLSQGVPCVAIGWSHKYKMLMRDYGCEEYLVELNTKNAKDKLLSLLDIDNYDTVKKKILSHAETQKQESREMWKRVFECISYNS